VTRPIHAARVAVLEMLVIEPEISSVRRSSKEICPGHDPATVERGKCTWVILLHAHTYTDITASLRLITHRGAGRVGASINAHLPQHTGRGRAARHQGGIVHTQGSRGGIRARAPRENDGVVAGGAGSVGAVHAAAGAELADGGVVRVASHHDLALLTTIVALAVLAAATTAVPVTVVMVMVVVPGKARLAKGHARGMARARVPGAAAAIAVVVIVVSTVTVTVAVSVVVVVMEVLRAGAQPGGGGEEQRGRGQERQKGQTHNGHTEKRRR